jgi:hypothetical protein
VLNWNGSAWVRTSDPTVGTLTANSGLTVNSQSGGKLTVNGAIRFADTSEQNSASPSRVGAGTDSVIGGGFQNTASAAYSTVSGGQTNTASGTHSSVLGGQSNNTNNYANAHIIGSNITADAANTTFVNGLKIVDSGRGVTFPDGTTQTTAAGGVKLGLILALT